ncbi:MAG: efflux RND transporter periplasmic adaptor subunit [Chitinophagaceae bacterium]|jgi:multidrug efflux pump subunit AcrA (membrane-fusion protein)|nr:efflux RND transporter periplasmic adaptor subunit [Chitinophagaceae bacterium]
MSRITIFFLFIFSGLFLISCKGKAGAESASDEDAAPDVKGVTSVTVTYPTDTVHIDNVVTLNAVAAYLLRSDAKANATGYITKMNIKLGDYVKKGATLFGLQTKEARALGNTINNLDPSFQFNGNTTVSSPATGYVSMVNHQTGDYVQDGEVLATVTDESSFGFILNLPYEYNQLIRDSKTINIALPDGRVLNGYIAKRMPTVDSASQTQQILIKINDAHNIPEGLLGNIKLATHTAFGITVPKTAVVADETQSSFWVMKLIDDSTAVKTEIEKGIEQGKWVQIKSGNIKITDRIITSGNFGLGDTASIIIQK